MAEYREARRWICISKSPRSIRVRAHVCISFFHMTYRRDYLDVDPSLRFEADNASRIYGSLFSVLSSVLYRRTHRSSLRPWFFIGIPEHKKKSVRRDWKAIPSSGNTKRNLFLSYHCPSSSTSPLKLVFYVWTHRRIACTNYWQSKKVYCRNGDRFFVRVISCQFGNFYGFLFSLGFNTVSSTVQIWLDIFVLVSFKVTISWFSSFKWTLNLKLETVVLL